MQKFKNFLKNKYIWIGIIVIFLIIIYIISEKILNTNGVKISQEETDEINSEQISNENIIPNLQEESVSEIEETIITENTNTEENNLETTEVNTNQENEQIYKNTESSEKIYVYITGEVNSPGVVLLDSGSRIVDAIEAAGGVTDKANITKVNLVYILQDGMKINIPNQNDLKNNENFEYITMSSGDEKNDANINNSASNTSSEESSSNKESAFKISVINYRKENGKFSSIEDIKNVSGIGDAKFENIKNYIRV